MESNNNNNIWLLWFGSPLKWKNSRVVAESDGQEAEVKQTFLFFTLYAAADCNYAFKLKAVFEHI